LRPSHRPLARRPHDENPRDRRRPRQSTGAQPYWWQRSRHHASGTVGGAQVEPEALLGDKGYDTDSFITSLEVRAIKAVIPPRSTRKTKRACDFALYAERNLVERFFNTIKHYRGIATRYEKTARNFLAGLHLVCALAWLK
jgi:transposase